MKKSSVSIRAVLAMLLATSPLAAQTDQTAYLSFLSPADRGTLMSKGELVAIGASQSDLKLFTKAPFASEMADELVPSSSVAIEGLFLFPRPSGDAELAIYNAMNSVASMEGLEYYSVSKKAYDKLILASYRVTSAQKPDRLPDPTFSVVPPFQKAVVYQKDNRLGDGLSEIIWRTTAQGLIMTFSNLDQLKYGILPLVDPGKMKMLFVVRVLSDKVVVYAVMEAKTASLFGLERSKDESFRNRLKALASWLGKRIESAAGAQ